MILISETIYQKHRKQMILILPGYKIQNLQVITKSKYPSLSYLIFKKIELIWNYKIQNQFQIDSES